MSRRVDEIASEIRALSPADRDLLLRGLLNLPIPNPQGPDVVTAVEALPNFRLRVRFNDGLEGTVDMSAMVRRADAGVFAALADEGRFNQVYIEFGAVTWPGEIDLAPDAMYDEIKKNGSWTLT